MRNPKRISRFDATVSKIDAVAVSLTSELTGRRVALDGYTAPPVPVDHEADVTERSVPSLPDDKPSERRVDPVMLDLFCGQRSPGDEVLSSGATNNGEREPGRFRETETRERRAPRVPGIQADRSQKSRDLRTLVRTFFLHVQINESRIEMRRRVITLR